MNYIAKYKIFHIYIIFHIILWLLFSNQLKILNNNIIKNDYPTNKQNKNYSIQILFMYFYININELFFTNNINKK